MKRRSFALALLGVCCQRSAPGVVKEAEFGVFFGGQVQELSSIPKELDAARQRFGFRIAFADATPRDVKVTWELSLPQSDKGGPRAARVGEVTAKVGQTSLDVPLSFRPTDPLGVWHAKLVVDGQTVVERDFTVVGAPPAPRPAPKPLAPRVPGSPG